MPERSVIANTSPLLYLHQVAQLELLQKLYGTVQVPQAVVQELGAGKAQGINVPELATIDWVQSPTLPSLELIPNVMDLGQGEAEVIALGLMQPGSLLVIDDALGRQIAELYQLKYTGTVGVLIKAKQSGYLEAVGPILNSLRHKACG